MVPNTGTTLTVVPNVVIFVTNLAYLRDAFARALSEAERVRCFRADLQSAPERLRASFPSVLRPRRGVLPLHRDRRRTSNARPDRIPGSMAWS